MTSHPSPTLFAVDHHRVQELDWASFPAGDGVRQKALYTDGPVTAGLLLFGPDARELTHMHRDGEHHIWVLRGSLLVDETRLEAGSYLHVPSHLWHSITAGAAGCQAFYVYCPTGHG